MSANLRAVHVVDHPLLARSLAVLRAESTSCEVFKHHLRLAARFLTFAATENIPLMETVVRTPLAETPGRALEFPMVAAPILRAGLGMLEGVSEMIPDLIVGHIGLFRDETTLEPQPYYHRLPENLDQHEILLIDPMLATGGSSIAGASLLKDHGATKVRFLNLVSCPAGIEAFHEAHPDIPIYTAACDSHLNDQAYIVPGLGDAGDRFFGTV